MELKKIVRNGLLLCITAIGFYLALMWFFNQFTVQERRAILWAVPYLQRKGGHEKILFDDFEKNRPYDVVVIGSSHAYRGYDPREFEKAGLTLFTMGTSSQHPVASKLLIENYFNLEEKPLVIYELYDMTFMLEGVECNTRLIQNVPDPHAAWQMATEGADLRNWNAWVNRLMTSGIPSEFDVKGYVSNGFATQPDSAKKSPSPIEKKFIMRKNMLNAFDESLSKLEEFGLRYVLVSHPQPNVPGYEVFHKQFLRDINPVLAEHEALYIDLSLDHPLHSTHHFYDAHHLNQAGVNVFNTIIIDSLVARGLLHLP
ncbi:MAG: hypothetical protein SH856_11185 [Flavobacteriales bacterium]|nr:hypothetical protein [Flavobacteriales bacterium]